MSPAAQRRSHQQHAVCIIRNATSRSNLPRHTWRRPLSTHRRQAPGASYCSPVPALQHRRAAAQCAAAAADDLPLQSKGRSAWQAVCAAFADLRRSLDGTLATFVPMAALFFAMSFINTILDSLKDTIIFTQAVGGGAHVVPWLTGVRFASNMPLSNTIMFPRCQLVLAATAALSR